jgi:dipeptidyl aminopeptidase/acylaminoacyl peptidase
LQIARHIARLFALAVTLLAASAALAAPETVYFMSADGKTEIVGYLFSPIGPAPHPAMVMLHGRAGPYSTNDNATSSSLAPWTRPAMPTPCQSGM